MIKVLKITGLVLASVAISIVGMKVQCEMLEEIAKALKLEE